MNNRETVGTSFEERKKSTVLMWKSRQPDLQVYLLGLRALPQKKLIQESIERNFRNVAAF